MVTRELDALVVLGCRVQPQGTLTAAAERRVQRAARAFADGFAPNIITSGGKRWAGRAEADAFRDRLVELGVPSVAVLPELRSMNTRQNARFASRLARERGLLRLGVVTCEWHMARALSAFRFYGVEALPLAAATPFDQDWLRRAAEGLHRLADRACLAFERALGDS